MDPVVRVAVGSRLSSGSASALRLSMEDGPEDGAVGHSQQVKPCDEWCAWISHNTPQRSGGELASRAVVCDRKGRSPLYQLGLEPAGLARQARCSGSQTVQHSAASISGPWCLRYGWCMMVLFVCLATAHAAIRYCSLAGHSLSGLAHPRCRDSIAPGPVAQRPQLGMLPEQS
jgi:hypothetical protein